MPPIEHVRESRDSRAHTRAHSARSRKDITTGRVRPRRIPLILRGIPATRPNVGVVSDDRRDKLRTWSDRSHRHSWPDASPDKFIKSLAKWIFVSRKHNGFVCHYKIDPFYFLTFIKRIREKIGTGLEENKKRKRKGKTESVVDKGGKRVRARFNTCQCFVTMFLQWRANRSVFADGRHCVDRRVKVRTLIDSSDEQRVHTINANFLVKHN